MNLIVTLAFGSYAVGALITDAGEIAAILASENANRVVSVAAAPAPAKGS